MRAAIDHIGVAASIAEIYAERMRAFQRAGNEPRAIAAFKLAVDWMSSYAASATSGGEGAALSTERDEFHAALVEFEVEVGVAVRGARLAAADQPYVRTVPLQEHHHIGEIVLLRTLSVDAVGPIVRAGSDVISVLV